MAIQLNLDLPTAVALGREDFFVSEANANAMALIEAYDTWEGGKCLLIGPEASGKTHLSHVWAALAEAQIISAKKLAQTDIDLLAARALSVEDIDHIAGHHAAEEALFHLHNRIRERRLPLLMTSRRAPGKLKFALPDLQSRVQGTIAVELSPPDDALLAAVLLKQFSDRQLRVAPNLIPYMLPRMERSFAGARALAEALDHHALSAQSPITQRLVRRVLDKLPASNA